MNASSPRPLVITDCDEVLLHMVAPFRDWLAETQGVAFDMTGQDFARGMKNAATGETLDGPEIWRLLGLFFDGEMHRQMPIAGSIAAMGSLAEHADVVVLTNLNHERNEKRRLQLADHGLNLRVFTNTGPKGPALKAILDEYRPSRAVFIDDLAHHHGSVAEISPEVHRLHFCGEPLLSPSIACAHAAGHAHARIDEWEHAVPWLIDRLTREEQPA